MKGVVLVLFFAALVLADVAPLLHTDGPNVIPGSYIVVLKDGLGVLDRDAHISDLKNTILATNADAEVGFVYNIGSLIGFSARLNEDLLKAELVHPDVKYIEADQVMSINYDQEKGERSPLDTITQTGATWGLVRVGQRALQLTPENYAYNSSAGQGVSVYVIDTGILTTHQDFDDRAKAVFNSITNEAPTDLNGHGTHCAGTIAGTRYGVAKLSSLFAVKVLSAYGSGSTSGVAAGIDYVTNNRGTAPSVASMSLGGGVSTVMDDAVANSIASGVVYSIAAGNSNANACNYSPARVPSAVTVGATQNDDYRSSYSNFGDCVDIFAPGTSITSDWIGSDTATNTISGTSMATPHVAGILALRFGAAPTSTPADLDAWIKALATPDLVQNVGTGSPNLLAYSDPAPSS